MSATETITIIIFIKFFFFNDTATTEIYTLSLHDALPISTIHARGIQDHPDALSRVLQGVDQGVLVGIGFLGGGILLRDLEQRKVFNLTTAAEVWSVAAMEIG